MIEAATAKKPENLQDAAVYFVLTQNNTTRRVTVREASPAAATLIGRDVTELEGADFAMIAGKKTLEAMADYLEYEEGAHDLDEVMSKMQDFRIRHANGEEIPLVHKIIRDPAQDQHHWFRLILKDERRQIAENSLRKIIRDNLAGIRSADSDGMADRYTADKYLEIIRKYVNSHDLDACFAILRIDRHEKNVGRYGRSACMELVEHVARCCRSKFRDEDMVCRLSDSTLGLFLLDIKPESVRVVLNRLRWFIGSHRITFGGKMDFSVTVSIIFADIKKNEQDNLIDQCEKEVAAIHIDERNVLLELK
jgi:GGDEF domain-containing protein